MEQKYENSKEKEFLINEKDLADIETQSSINVKNMFAKVSRFQHSEQLQFTEKETDKNISISNSSEQAKNLNKKIILFLIFFIRKLKKKFLA